MGGESEESVISRRSGANVLTALQNIGYDTLCVELDQDFPNVILDYKPDLVFLALHGEKGENGSVQGFLELMNIPYTGSGIAASAICMDKVLTKKMLNSEAIPTPEFAVLKMADYFESSRAIEELQERPGLPLVIKPASQGSSIGASIVKTPEELKPALDLAFDFDQKVLAERFIEGVELTVAVMGNNEGYVLPVLEIVPEAGEWYDYESKYAAGGSSHIYPPRIAPDLVRRAEMISKQCYESLGCRGFARIDVMVDTVKQEAYILEVNTIPGMTDTSLVPDAVRAAGMSWEEFVEKVVRLALQNR